MRWMKAGLVISALFIAGCNSTLWGTNTGNPDMSSPTIGDGAMTLGEVVCYKIQSCYNGASSSSCLNQISSLNHYTSELGPNASAYATLLDLYQAESQHLITANSTNASTCKQAISALSCSDTLIQNSYSVSSPTDYSVTNILFRSSTSCAQIY